MEQDEVPGLHRIGAAEQELDRHALQHHSGGRLEIDRIRQLDQALGRVVAEGGIGAVRGRAIGDAVARLELGDAGPDCLHRAGGFQAEAARHGQGIEAAALVGVDEVEAAGMVPDRDLAGPGGRNLDLLPAHHLRSAMFMDADGIGLHRSLPTAKTGAATLARPRRKWKRGVGSASRSRCGCGPTISAGTKQCR